MKIMATITFIVSLYCAVTHATPLALEKSKLLSLYKEGDIDALAILIYQDCKNNEFGRASSLLEILKEHNSSDFFPRYSWIEPTTHLDMYCSWFRKMINR